MPKEPPTSGVMMRTLSSGTLKIFWASCGRMRIPPWVLVRRTRVSLSASYSPRAARGSIGATTTRLLTSSKVVTCLALAKAASAAAASPISQSRQRLFGASSQICGESGCRAAAVWLTTGRSS